MGNNQTSNSESNPAINCEDHLDTASSHHGGARGSISKTMSRGKNFIRLSKKRFSGTWEYGSSKQSSNLYEDSSLSHSGNLVENEFSNVFPSASVLERRSTVTAVLCSDVAGSDTEDHDPSLNTSTTTSNNNNIKNNNNFNINNKTDEEEIEIKHKNNRFVSSLTGKSSTKITSSAQLHLSQSKLTQISSDSTALHIESNKSNSNQFQSNNSNNNKIKTNIKLKQSALNCDTEIDDKNLSSNLIENKEIFVQTESWHTAKSYTEAIKQRRDSSILDKAKSPSRESIIIRECKQPPHSSSSESNFTDPQTLLSPDLLNVDGFITEINECYYSDESDQDKNIAESRPKNIFKNLSVVKNESINIVDSELTFNSDKTLNLSIETLHKISIVDDISPLTVEILDPISIFSNSYESIVNTDSDEEMSSVTKMKSNKITPLSISNRTPSNSKTTSSRISSSTTGSLFNVARVKKVELSDLNKNGGSAVERLSKTNTSGNVLRKVASITATANTDTSKKQQESKPSFVPEKLNFGAYEKFEGQMLINWFQSTLSGGTVNTEDSAPSRLVLQCCTNLLVAGVIKQIPDKHAAVQDVFKPNLMYQWTHTEVPKLEAIPGKLNSSDFWPHTDDSPTPTPKMPSITFTSTPKILNDVSNQLPKLADVKNIINKCETMDELCNTMQQLMLQESANMRNTNSFNDNCSPIIKKQNNLSINNNNDGDDDKSVSDMSEYRTGSASMFQSALDKTDLLKFDNSAINEIESDVKVKEIGVQTEMINNNCEEKEIQTISVRTENKEIQTDNSESEKNLIKSEEKTETPMNPVNSAPLPPPPPPPPIMNNIPKPPPMMIPNQGIPKPPPLVPAGTISSCPVPPPPMPMGMTSNGPPIPPPAPTGKPPGAMNPPALPLPKQTDWQTTITLRKPVKNPPKPMKPLFWTRIVTKPPVTTPIQIETDAVDATEPPATLGESEKTPELWQEIDETSLDNLDEFTELFSRQVVAPKQKTRDEKARPAKVETIKVLDSKRSQTVGIFARSLHVGFEEIEHAIYHCDTSVVSLETLQHIMAIKATPDELAQIKEVATGDVPLDAPEKFLLHISKISSFSERISCIVLQAEFDEAVSTVSRKLETIIRVCTFIIESDNLKIIFSIILTLGNYMNGGNRTRGQADGFGLEILGKLKDVKSKDSKITLLHFIVKTFIQQARKNGTLITELVLPIPDPTDIDKSLNVDFDDCKQQLNILQSKLNSCRKTIDVVISASGDSANPFKDKMNAFLEEATLRLENKFEKLEKSKKIFIQALAFYKFNPKSGTLDECTPSQFFELWTPFTHDFRDIWIKEIDVLTNEIIKKSKKASVKSTKSNSTSQPSGKQPSKLKQRIAQLRNRDN